MKPITDVISASTRALLIAMLLVTVSACSPNSGNEEPQQQVTPRTDTGTSTPELSDTLPEEEVAEPPQNTTPDPQEEEQPEPTPPLPVTVFSAAEASRFLSQATFGATKPEIDYLFETRPNYEAWIDEQIAMAPSLHSDVAHRAGQDGRLDVWWTLSTNAQDQLRQRAAFALSQVLVLSDTPDILFNNGDAVIGYYDLLVSGVFGNYRDLLKQITVNLPMGIYLSLKDSQKADPDTGVRPDENYAREIMQLFSIGLVQLNPDGTPQLVDGKPVPTYTQSDIEELSRIFSGWGADNAFFYGFDFSQPMKAYDEYHDNGAKEFLGHSVSAGLTAEQDLDNALDIIFNHDNVGPFISKQLIQRLVTSNPSPEYVSRVSAVFNDNGEGVRGDLGAVFKAILLDSAARDYDSESDSFGKLREPLIRVTHLFRMAKGMIEEGNFWRPATDFLQAPLNSPTVFNFYFPNFSPGGEIQDAGLVAPEFQITTTSSITTVTNKLYAMSVGAWNASSTIDVSDFAELSANAIKLVDYLDLVLMAETMSDGMRNTLVDYINSSTSLTPEQLTRDVIHLVLTSAEFAVQR